LWRAWRRGLRQPLGLIASAASRYTACAGAVQPALAQGIPNQDDFPVIGDDYVLPAGWKGTSRGMPKRSPLARSIN
jgi:hypothetical protein